METSERPWGAYTVLSETPSSKTKIISVLPGHRLSYQTHKQRSEHWVIVEGVGKLTLDGVITDCSAGDVFTVPVGAAHRVENVGSSNLVFVEVQLGSSFGEDDIVRLEDDYNR
jgi:mannose-6-phosphate isomerase